MRTSLFSMLLCTMCLACSTKENNSSKDPLVASIDSVIQAAADTARFNGNILVASNGKIIYSKSVGYANYDTKSLLNDSTVFELASVSKQFTAMAIMLLAERGQLSYADNIRKYIPELPYDSMTIRHFLTHTSGIPDYMDLFTKNWDQKKIAYNDDIIKLLATNKPPVLFKPGEKWEYSNTAYALLATIIERASGMSYGDFLKTNIFIPLDMRHTRTYNTRRSTGETIDNYAYGFVYAEDQKKFMLPDSVKELHFVVTLDGIQGDGIVNSTTGDLFKWDQALYTEKLISSERLKEAFTPVKLNDGTTYDYGFGWFIGQHPVAGKTVLHSGGWPGYATFIKRFIDQNKCFIILTNNDGYGREGIARELNKRLGR